MNANSSFAACSGFLPRAGLRPGCLGHLQKPVIGDRSGKGLAKLTT